MRNQDLTLEDKDRKIDLVYISWQSYPHENIRSWLRQGCIWQFMFGFGKFAVESESLNLQCSVLINVFESCRSSKNAEDLKTLNC